MFVQILKKMAGAAVWLLAIVGLLVAVMVWRLFSGDSKLLGESPPSAAVVAPGPAPGPAAALPASCLCADGGACVGPRGGRFCVTAAGGKKYL